MSEIAIKLENISKQYRLGNVGTGTLSQDLNRWWANIRGKEDPNLKIGQSNELSKAGGDYVWALNDINLEIKKGEILGVIGKNGAGKSTLLKLLSQVTGPTTGQIKVDGRIASLLEVGTGFHPELTGRENIFLNGAILGMRKWEIKSKLDEIVDFAGVEKYIDTPVKRYSSGMYVRLAFAVAAHLEPDILVVDEVLAVGDAEFQKKAIGKMNDVSKNSGRTVLFVSHNMSAIQSLCKTGIILENGLLKDHSDISEVISNYAFKQRHVNCIDLSSISRPGLANIDFKYLQMKITNEKGLQDISEGDAILVELKFRTSITLNSLGFGVSIKDGLGNTLIACRSFGDLPELKLNASDGKTVTAKIYQNLKAGTYSITVDSISTIGPLDFIPAVYTLFIKTKDDTNGEPWYKTNVGAYNVQHNWQLE
jgi:lipopolysaccharide transport system ATP-binding protein